MMTIKKTVDSYMTELAPEKREIAETLRKIILTADPELQESVKWGNPVYEKKGRVCYIADMGAYMNLGLFKGAHLADPTGRIEGTGKDMRHVKVKGLDDVQEEQFSSWVRETVALNESAQR